MNSTEEPRPAAGGPEIEAWAGWARITLSAAEQVWAAHMNIVRACFADGAGYARAVFEAEHAEDVCRLHATLLEPAIARALRLESANNALYGLAQNLGEVASDAFEPAVLPAGAGGTAKSARKKAA